MLIDLSELKTRILHFSSSLTIEIRTDYVFCCKSYQINEFENLVKENNDMYESSFSSIFLNIDGNKTNFDQFVSK